MSTSINIGDINQAYQIVDQITSDASGTDPAKNDKLKDDAGQLKDDFVEYQKSGTNGDDIVKHLVAFNEAAEDAKPNGTDESKIQGEMLSLLGNLGVKTLNSNVDGRSETLTAKGDTYTASSDDGKNISTTTFTKSKNSDTMTKAEGMHVTTKTSTKTNHSHTETTDDDKHITTSTGTNTGKTGSYTTDDDGHIVTVTKTGKLVTINDGNKSKSYIAHNDAAHHDKMSAQEIAEEAMGKDAANKYDKDPSDANKQKMKEVWDKYGIQDLFNKYDVNQKESDIYKKAFP